MVYLIPASDCQCWSCNGGTRAPEGVYGGSHCMCQCHSMNQEDRATYITKKIEEFQAALKKSVDENIAFTNRIYIGE